MSLENKPTDTLELPASEVISIAVEHWRLSTWVATLPINTGIARHALRRLSDLLTRWQIEAKSLDGQPFDAGLAAKVVDIVDDPSTPAGLDLVEETVSPLILWRGKVVRPAEIVVRRGTGKK